MIRVGKWKWKWKHRGVGVSHTKLIWERRFGTGLVIRSKQPTQE